MMKKYWILFSLFFAVLSTCAQGYDELWQQARKASLADLPKTAAQYVRRIHHKALSEGNTAQLLKAALSANVYGSEISPDSLKISVEQMERALSAEKRPVVCALWHSALGRIYSGQPNYGNAFGMTGDALQKLKEEHLEAALLHDDTLAQARVADWLPLFKSGADSHFFSDDLFHVLFNQTMQTSLMTREQRAERYGCAIALYRGLGNRDAVLLLTLDSLNASERGFRVNTFLEEDVLFHQYLDLARTYRSQSSNVKTYTSLVNFSTRYERNSPYAAHNDSLLVALARQGIELYAGGHHDAMVNALRNFVREAENPQAEIEGIDDVLYPSSSQPLTLYARNLSKVTLRVTRIYASRADYDLAERTFGAKSLETLVRQHQRSSQLHEYAFQPTQAWRRQSLNVVWQAPKQCGVYCAELIMNGKSYAKKVFSVSSIRPLIFSYAPGQNRVVAVDSRSGRPVKGAEVVVYDYQSGRRKCVYAADTVGTVFINIPEHNRPLQRLYLTTRNECSAPAFDLSNIRNYGEAVENRMYTHVELFTDRGIYRPGQEVDFSGVAYTRQSDLFKVLEGVEGTVNLYNVNHKKIDSLTVRTDAFGVISGRFRLPQVSLPGYYSLEARISSRTAEVGFRVEEYKRPTFTTEVRLPEVAYCPGDSVHLSGEAKTYSGVPVVGARVQFSVHRESWFRTAADVVAPQSGETRTDESGRFVLPLHLAVSKVEQSLSNFNRYFYRISYTITADNGETVQGATALSTATRPAWYEASLPSSLCKESLPLLTVHLYNASGRNMEARLPYEVRNGHELCFKGSFTTGEPFDLKPLGDLPTGKYELHLPAAQGAQADTLKFILFSELDARPVDAENPFFAYHRITARGDSAIVLVGTPERDAVIFYDLLANGRMVESRRLFVSDSLHLIKLAYQPDYGDGATAFFAMVRDGNFYRYQVSVQKPEPDKRLLLSWKTFRSRLTPGQSEEWRLTVKNVDGTPANAGVTARMYDASLNAFAECDWHFGGLYFNRLLPVAQWHCPEYRYPWSRKLTAEAPFKYLTTGAYHFTTWLDELFAYNGTFLSDYGVSTKGRFSAAGKFEKPIMVECATDMAMQEAETTTEMKRSANVLAGAGAPKAEAAMQAINLRSDFSETAFFRPALRTDLQGEVCIAFDLPESMTQWSFTALAHDRQMNHGRLDTTIVARKDFMVEPALPRFMRKGDVTTLPVKITNLTQSEITARLTLTLTDAFQEGKTEADMCQTLSVAAGASVVHNFVYKVDADADMLVARVIAEGGGFSDGEAHYVPILSDLEQITRTLPFSMTESGKRTFVVDTLFSARGATHRALTVELSSNPLWYVVSALPVLAGKSTVMSATEWGCRFYAMALADRVAKLHPEIAEMAISQSGEAAILANLQCEELTDATPWLQEAQAQRQRASALAKLFDPEWSAANRATSLAKLEALQRSDGSWSWYPGMSGNDYITVEVALMLARVERLTENYEAKALLARADAYLRAAIAKEVKQMRQNEKQTHRSAVPSEFQLRYLYFLTVRGERFGDDARYLLSRANELCKELSMYGKSVLSVVQAENGCETEARLNLESLLEHTVGSAEKGLWFDTSRAHHSGASYRIPTQCAAIEALAYFGRKPEVDAMRLWLLQAKRTQMWETSRATADAVYTLLSTNEASSSVGALSNHAPLLYTLYKGRKIVGLNAPTTTSTPATVGYYRDCFDTAPAVEATALTIDKRSNGLSWGSVYATFTLPGNQVKAAGKGLFLEGSIEVKRGNDWQPISMNEVLHKGDRVRRLFVLTADGDYDFVRLNVSRPVCCEPINPLSGYQWGDGLSAYRAPHDVATEYFIEHLPKGRHAFSEELFVVRSGRYATGITTLQSVFAPEFKANDREALMIVE